MMLVKEPGKRFPGSANISLQCELRALYNQSRILAIGGEFAPNAHLCKRVTEL